MNKYFVYLAVFAVVCAVLAQDCEAKSAVKKRSAKLKKSVDMTMVKAKVQAAAVNRNKRNAETVAELENTRRHKRSAGKVDQSMIAAEVKASLPNIQNIKSKLSKRAVSESAQLRKIKTRKARSLEKRSGFKRTMVSKLGKVGKNMKKFHKK